MPGGIALAAAAWVDENGDWISPVSLCVGDKGVVTALGGRPVRSVIVRDVSALLALALVCRLAFLIAMPRVLDTADAVHYFRAAEHIASGSLLAADP